MPTYHKTAAPPGEEAGRVGKLIWDEDHVIVDELTLPAMATDPDPPDAGNLHLYAQSRAGRVLLKMRGPSGLDTALQPMIAFNNVSWLRPSTGSTLMLGGIPHNNTGATLAHPALAATNLLTSTRRWRNACTGTAPQGCGTRSNLTMCWRGNAAGLGGWFTVWRGGMSTIAAGQTNAFIGLRSTTAVIAAGTEPSTLTNIIGFGFDRADSNWLWLVNDGSGAAAEVDLGSGFAVNTTDLVEFATFAAPNGSEVFYSARNLSTGASASGSASSDLPSSATFLATHIYASVNSGATMPAIDSAGLYLETDY